MKTKILIPILIFVVCAFPSLALTPQERKLAKHALTELQAAKQQFADAQKHAGEADARAAAAEQHAAQADQHAATTDAAAKKTGEEIEISHKNEQKMADLVNKYQPFWDQGHAYWGLGAIGLGLGMLFKHVIILIGVILLILVVVFFLTGGTSGAAMPYIARGGSAIASFFRNRRNPKAP